MNKKMYYPWPSERYLQNFPMRTTVLALGLLSIILISACATDKVEIPLSTSYPAYGAEKEVAIQGLTFDAMEPFLSPDGQYLFFNNLNDGIDTKLFLAAKVNDSVFTYLGELEGANQASPPHLDAVADMDAAGNFYWTSTRNYPAELNNLFHGTFSSGNLVDISRVAGDFNKNEPGWLVMDHGISADGTDLYVNNARFDSNNCLGPCETVLELAERVDATTFRLHPDSANILQNINDAGYIYYAPCISSDQLELYYTRYLKGGVTASSTIEICVAVRTEAGAPFSEPTVLFSDVIANLIEAPTLTHDKNIIYYHRKTADSHKIVMRYRKAE